MLKELDDSESLIYRALLKYGYSAFRLDIIEYCDISILTEREQYYLDNLKHEYNILPFAYTTLGHKHRPETLEKMRRSRLKLNVSGENHPFYGKKQSPGAKDKLKEFQSNRMYTPRMKGSGEEVEITDLETGNKTVYGSIRLAAESIGVSHPTIHKRDKDLKNTGVNEPIIPKKGGLFLSVIKIKEPGKEY